MKWVFMTDLFDLPVLFRASARAANLDLALSIGDRRSLCTNSPYPYDYPNGAELHIDLLSVTALYSVKCDWLET